MPVITKTTYTQRPFYMLNGHWETVIPSVFFKVKDISYKRSRFELDDGDFLDVDFLKSGYKRCLIISHGLEGGSDRYYVRRTASYFHSRGWDIVAWNCRSCSGEMNRHPRFYHHGDTEDLAYVVDQMLDRGYESIVLLGYSMGGSMSLKYLGERSHDARIKGAITFSVPCNLKNSSDMLRLKENRLYESRFLTKLKEKIRLKSVLFPERIDAGLLDQVADFDRFHELFTAPLHGFESAESFFLQSTCDRYFEGIEVPVLIANALNDPMLGDLCYPRDVARDSDFIYLEMPDFGGHCGFTLWGKDYSWMESRAESFIREQGW